MKKPDDHQSESDRILKGVQRDTETIGTSSFVRISNHITAKDADQNDPVEVWAKRTGRALSAIAFVLLALWLLNWLNR